MATYYVSSVDGDDGDDGLSWANAKATLAGALSVATASGDVIKVSHIHQDVLSADTTFTVQNNIAINVVDRSSGDALAVMDGTNGYIGHTTTSYAVIFAGGYNVFFRGLYVLGSGTTSKNITLSSVTAAHHEYHNCKFKVTGHSASTIHCGDSGQNRTAYLLLKNCELIASNTAQRIITVNNCKTELINTVTSGSNGRFLTVGTRGGYVSLDGCDIANCSNDALFANNTISPFSAFLNNCKLPASTDILAEQDIKKKASTEVTCFNCSSGDTNYSFFHGNGLGSTTAVVDYYADDGATDQNNTRISYKVTTTAGASIWTPYVGPWIAKPHIGTSAVTPSFEGLRVNSATVIQNDEVWGEWSFQGTSGSTRASFVNDAMIPLGSAADQDSSKTYADWTGSPTDTDSGDSVFKLAAGSAITPAEVGHIMGRVVVGEPSLTVYYDPQIRLT
jgi:hypothetical protein